MKTITKDTGRIKNISSRTDWSSTFNQLSSLRNKNSKRFGMFR